MNNEIIESNNFAVPEIRFLDVISSNAVVMASPGTKIIIADIIVSPTLSSGNTNDNNPVMIVARNDTIDSRTDFKYSCLVDI